MGTLGPRELVAAVVLVVCAATDLRTGRIYNAVTYPAMAAGVAIAATGYGPGIASSAAGFFVGGVPLYLFFAAGWMGGGDVKLMAAVGALTGFPFILHAMFYSIFLAGVSAGLVLIWRGHARTTAREIGALIAHGGAAITPRGGSFPFGAAICAGTLVAMILTHGVLG